MFPEHESIKEEVSLLHQLVEKSGTRRREDEIQRGWR